jgi:outer membrane protein TolC
MLVVFLILSMVPPPNCDALRNLENILTCALVHHPEIQTAEISVQQGSALKDAASTWLNPDFSSQVVFGRTASQQMTFVEFNITQPIELGGKLGARKQFAESQTSQRLAEQLGIQEKVFIKTLTTLFHIRQLQDLLRVLDDALDSFEGISKKYRARPILNPEQRASLSLFEIAANDYALRKSPLQAELDRDLRFIEYALGHHFDPRPDLLPKTKSNWPKINTAQIDQQSVENAQVHLAQAELKLAQARQTLAQSLAWPDLRIGPTFLRQPASATNYFNAYGFNLQFPLPVLNRNTAGKAYAEQDIRKNQIRKQAIEKENRDERAFHLTRYESAVSALTKVKPNVTQKHDDIEKLFNQGLLSGTFVTEVHRQVFDFTKSRNELELAAVESLAYIYAFNGDLLSHLNIWDGGAP